MDSRLLELANQIKSLAIRIKIEKRKDLSFRMVDELSDITTLDNLIWLCNEITNVGEMKPVGYLSATASVCLRRGKQTIITPENEGNCTPLYRLDK
ncbi:hypothetical protein [Morganella morganii]|uniref:hypothetical protein n=1 Tax=Morganella morganii TaxID=582 RepID=UPI0023686A4C|nr:hypothetical protein [Morganella morganii]